MASSDGPSHHRDGSKSDANSGQSSSSTSRPSSSAAGTGSGIATGSSSTSTSTTKRQASKQPVRIGQYELKQTLGSGSFGKVKCAYILPPERADIM